MEIVSSSTSLNDVRVTLETQADGVCVVVDECQDVFVFNLQAGQW